ncbi:MAG TPA: hypothetical protein VFJ14_01390 [Nocardioidaceae bacterium]|nr:hypothetical protein [Nocardioidaceae bacterium]
MSGVGSRVGVMLTAQVAGVVAVLAYVLLVEWAVANASYDVWSALVVIPMLLLLSGHLIVRAGRRQEDPRFLRLLAVAFALKALATVARYLMAFVVYDGQSDAAVYHDEGARLAESYRDGFFDAEIGRDFIGSGFIRVLNGLLYAVTGPSIFVSYAFFAWMGFWGLYFFYRAFCVGVPDGNHHRYAIMVLFLPSMLFWPSSLGKEAWMTFAIGLSALGTARLLGGHRKWLFPMAIGLTATAMVRPHITAALFAGVAVAVLLRRSQRPTTPLSPLSHALTIAVVFAAGFFIVRQAASFLGVEDPSISGVDAAIDATQERTADGGSEFTPVAVNSPLDMPWAVISVLFRPFIFEANNVASLIAATEGTALLALLLVSLPRLRGLLGGLTREPYLIVCVVYTLLFVYAFSNFSNFGILTRQRVQVLPFVLVFFALPITQNLPLLRQLRPTRQKVSP